MILVGTLLEILKYIIPTVVVYFLIKQFMTQQLQLSAMDKKSEIKKETLGL